MLLGISIVQVINICRHVTSQDSALFVIKKKTILKRSRRKAGAPFRKGPTARHQLHLLLLRLRVYVLDIYSIKMWRLIIFVHNERAYKYKNTSVVFQNDLAQVRIINTLIDYAYTRIYVGTSKIALHPLPLFHC